MLQIQKSKYKMWMIQKLLTTIMIFKSLIQLKIWINNIKKPRRKWENKTKKINKNQKYNRIKIRFSKDKMMPMQKIIIIMNKKRTH